MSCSSLTLTGPQEYSRVPVIMPTRFYEVHRARNRFFCQGRVVQGPDKEVLATIVMLLIPAVLFTAFEGFNKIFGCLLWIWVALRWRYRVVTDFGIPFWVEKLSALVPVTFYLLLLTSVASLAICSSMDPGIIPRGLHPRPPEPPIDVDANGRPTAPLPPLTYEVYHVRGVEVRTKYCHTCSLARPPRSSHCSRCDNCIERFDHHCPWVGNCIGRRNHRYFVVFLTSTMFLTFYVFGWSLAHLVLMCLISPSEAPSDKLRDGLSATPISAVLMFYTAVSALNICGLAIIHLYLMCTNHTTNEQIKSKYTKNAFTNGLWLNFVYFCCGPRYPAFVDFHAVVADEPSTSMKEVVIPVAPVETNETTSFF